MTETDLDRARSAESARVLGSISSAGGALEATLQTVLERVVDWLKYEEAKNGVLVTLNGVAVGFLVQWLGSTSVWLSFVFRVCIFGFIVSLLIGLLSFYPVTDTQRVHKRAAKDRSRRPESDDNEDKEPNVLFFGDIGGLGDEEYLAKLRFATQGSEVGGSTQLERDYAHEIVANSELALLKVRAFRRAFRITFASLAAVCLAVIVDECVKIWSRI
jgi:hypothetical protein